MSQQASVKISEVLDSENQPIQVFDILFPGRLMAKLSTLGGILMSLQVPDRSGQLGEVVLGYADVACYRPNPAYLGALIGRFANRLSKGQFVVNGQQYQLEINNGNNQLHGGLRAFDAVIWQAAAPEITDDAVRIALRYTSPAGEGGYPGTLSVEVVYTFTAEGFQIDYRATTDAACPVNLTQHSYFNLSGDLQQSILDHQLQLAASRFAPITSEQLPVGNLVSVANTPFDFRESKTVGRDIAAADEQLARGAGYDHYYVADAPTLEQAVARLYHAASGRQLTVFSDAPGLQLYSGNFLGSGEAAAGCRQPAYRTGLCLETMEYPDAPNQPAFPSAILQPGAIYRSSTRYQFSVI